MKHEALTEKLIGTFYTLYNELGHGFLESIYQRGYAFMLSDERISFIEQAPVRVMHRGRDLGEFRMDLVRRTRGVVELKAMRALEQAPRKQVFNYLKATSIEVGLLLILVRNLNETIPARIDTSIIMRHVLLPHDLSVRSVKSVQSVF